MDRVNFLTGRPGKKGALNPPTPGGAKFWSYVAICMLAVCIIGYMEGGKGAITLNSISIDPNPSSIFDMLTVTADGEDVNYYDTNPDTDFAANVGGDPFNWQCMTVESDKTGDINHIDFDFINDIFSDCGLLQQVVLLEYLSATKSGEIYIHDIASFGGGSPSTCRTKDTNEFKMQADTLYWLCFFMTPNSLPLDTDTSETRFWYNGVTDPFGDMAGYTDRSSEGIPLFYPVIKVDFPTRLTVINAGGNYASDFLCRGDYVAGNPFCSFSNPCQAGNCTIKGKIDSVESGYSSEAQATINIGGGVEDLSARMPIYIMATSSQVIGLNEIMRLHNEKAFSAYPNGSYIGQIQVDGDVIPTCNLDWDCQTDIGTGSHSYEFYSASGSHKYSGVFSVDANAEKIKIYVPISYNIFDIWTDNTKTQMISCANIYSLDNALEVDNWARITTSVGDSPDYFALDSDSIIPRNCYAYPPYNLNPFTPQVTPVPTNVWYSDSAGEADSVSSPEGVWQQHSANDYLGLQNLQGFLNFISLYEDPAPPYSGDIVKRKATDKDGFYSPQTDLRMAGMNYETAIFADANYLPQTLAIGDNIYCEVRLETHGFTAYDVNILLIKDNETILDNFSTSLYRKYNFYTEGETNLSYGNLIWHKFEDVDPGEASKIQCAFQVLNELGFHSGWVFSDARNMYTARESLTGGVNLYVKDEDGTTSQLRHQSKYDGDQNVIDLYSLTLNQFNQYNTADNPLTIPSGNGFAITTDSNLFNGSNLWNAAKNFYTDIAASFTINLYLPDIDASDQAPVIKNSRIVQNTTKSTITCYAEYYDKDLDVNNVTFKFFTNREGNIDNPLCEERGVTYSTNCDLGNSGEYYTTKCLTTNYYPWSPGGIYSECGSDNDCEAEARFYYSDCVQGNSEFGYCIAEITDANGNKTYTQASMVLEMQEYTPQAECTIYNFPSVLDLENQADLVYMIENADYLNGQPLGDDIIYTSLPIFIECAVTVDEVLDIDNNFSVSVLNTTLPHWKENYSDFTGRTEQIFRGELTSQVVDFFESYSSYDPDFGFRIWNKGGFLVEFTHPIYEGFLGSVSVTIIEADFTLQDIGDYSEGNVDQLFYWMDNLTKDFLTNPIGAIPNHFFEVVVFIILIVIFGPLLLHEAKKQSVNVKVTNRK